MAKQEDLCILSRSIATLMGTTIARDAEGGFVTGEGDLARQEAL
jgi:hypothetical protein